MLPLTAAHLPGTGGRLSVAEAEEVLAKQPADTGGHWWVRVRKDGLGSRQAREAIARSVGADPALVSDAGNRDRAVTFTQWFSLPQSAVEHPGPLRRAGAHGKIRVLDVIASHKPFTAACVDRIRWTLRLKGAGKDDGYLKGKAKLDLLRREGIPNYVASARLGADNNWAHWGRTLLKGERLPAHLARQADPDVCRRAYQESLFNRYVASRLEAGLLGTALAGDLIQARTGAIDLVTDPAAAQKRLDSWEAVPLGPLFGAGMQQAGDEAAACERDLLADAELDPARLGVLEGGRRAIRVQPAKVLLDLQGADLVVTCDLPTDAAVEWLVADLIGTPAAPAPSEE